MLLFTPWKVGGQNIVRTGWSGTWLIGIVIGVRQHIRAPVKAICKHIQNRNKSISLLKALRAGVLEFHVRRRWHGPRRARPASTFPRRAPRDSTLYSCQTKGASVGGVKDDSVVVFGALKGCEVCPRRLVQWRHPGHRYRSNPPR